MDELLEAIRVAVASDTTDEARVAGALACRTILTALEARSGEQLAPVPALAPSSIANAIATLRGVPADQLLDLAIARLRAALPADASVPAVQPMKFHVIKIPQQLTTQGGR